MDKNSNHLGLSETSRYWPSLQEEDILSQRFRGHFMSCQLDAITACNQHDSLLGPFQYVGTTSLYAGNLKGRKTSSGNDPSGLGRWSYQRLRGQGSEPLRISTLYRPAPPAQGKGQGYVYYHHTTHFNKSCRRIPPRQGFLTDLKE